MSKSSLTSIAKQSLLFNVTVSVAVGSMFSFAVVQTLRNMGSTFILLSGLMVGATLETQGQMDGHIDSVISVANEFEAQVIPLARMVIVFFGVFGLALLLTIFGDRARLVQKFRPLRETQQVQLKENMGGEFNKFSFGRADKFSNVRLGKRQISLAPSVILGGLRGSSDALAIIRHEYVHSYAGDPFFSVFFRTIRTALFFPLFFVGFLLLVTVVVTCAMLFPGLEDGLIDDIAILVGMIFFLVLILKYLKIQRSNFYEAKEEFASKLPWNERVFGTKVVLASSLHCVLLAIVYNVSLPISTCIISFLSLMTALLLVAKPKLVQIATNILCISIVVLLSCGMRVFNEIGFRPPPNYVESFWNGGYTLVLPILAYAMVIILGNLLVPHVPRRKTLY